MVLAKNIYKNYSDFTILKGINLKIQKGEVVSIIGESGAGKSTLLQILGTLDTPSLIEKNKTQITIDKILVLTLKDKEISKFRNLNIGFIFQFHQLLPEFTALENVLIPAMIAKTNLINQKKYAEELLDIMNLSHRSNHKPFELSGGEKQRVAVARALINSPKVIFADEPSGNLDSKNAEELHQLFFKLRKQFNQTFLIVTHNQNLAKMSDRILTMKDGKFV